MKHLWNILAMLTLTASACHAQKTPVEKYELVPDGYMEVFLDHVARNSATFVTIPAGDYIGQADREGNLYGFGMYFGNDGVRATGMFRQGKLLFGITQTYAGCMVGSPERHVAYSNTTGRVQYLMNAGERLVMDGPGEYDYGFVNMNYANGDRYMGEIYRNKRHGYGIYYYANGDIWYGPYDNDARNGYGVLFTEENGMFLGEWKGEQVTKIIPIRIKD